MPNISHAVAEYGPKLELRSTVGLAELAEWVSGKIGLTADEIEPILASACEAVLDFCLKGQPVEIAGIGQVCPKITRLGELTIEYTLDHALKDSLNQVGAYQGPILNKDRVGWTNEQYQEAWERDHFRDPLQA